MTRDKFIRTLSMLFLPIGVVLIVCATGSFILWEWVTPTMGGLRFSVVLGLFLSLMSYTGTDNDGNS
jgi:hypothetical protein